MKNKITKTVTILIILLLIILLNKVVYAGTYTDGTNGTYEYEVISETEKTIKITKYTEGDSKEISIPGNINEYAVTSIGQSTFSNCEILEKITIPASVNNIEYITLYYCANLKEIISNSPYYKTENGVMFNADKTNLICYPKRKTETTFTIPETVKEIKSNAFAKCNNLTRIEMSNSVKKIGEDTFKECENLIQIELDEGLETIGSGAFDSCKKLTEITIPSSVLQMANNPFINCTSLKKITNNSPKYYTDEEGVLFNKDKTKLICYPIGKTETTYKIPEGVESICLYAFYNCEKLTNIEIPTSVTEIGTLAFYMCNKLEEITIPNSVIGIGSGAFKGCTSLTKVSALNSLSKNSSENSYIGFEAFANCIKLTEVTIPNSIKIIGQSAFVNTGLIEIVIPDSITTIYETAFWLCKDLIKVTIPKSVTDIGKPVTTYIKAHVFDDGNENLEIYCYSGSAAEKYAIDNNIEYVIMQGININETTKIITGNELINLTVNELKSKIQSIKNITAENILKVTNSVGTELTGENIVGTGTIVKIKEGTEEKEYTVLIYGDCNGDGKINAIDALAVIKNKTEAIKFKKEIFEGAGRIISKTGTPSAVDALAIIKHALGVQIINQEK